MTRPGSASLAGLTLAALVLTSCATPVGVERVDPRELRLELAESTLTGARASARTRQLLDRLALVEVWDDEPVAALEAIRSGIGEPDTPERLLGLAELSFAQGDRTGNPVWYRSAALAAYAYLFPGGDHPHPGAFDPGLRLATELYNRSLALGFSGQGEADLASIETRWALPYGEIVMTFRPGAGEIGWSGYRLKDAVPSSELRVRGLRNRYRRAGIGAPLSATVERDEGVAVGHRVGRQIRVPVTALLRIEEPWEAVLSGNARADLELYVMDRVDSVRIGDQHVPLEYEPTVSLAFGLENPLIWSFEFEGFFSGDFLPFEGMADGLVLLHPYRRGRVPVVLVHGTASTPGRWAELVNELQGDPAIADRVQLWLFLYNTGNPILHSASLLRKALTDTVADLDPDATDPALQHMVVAGHSQGGLLTKLQAVSSGSIFWDAVSERPLSEYQIEPETRHLIERAMFFERLPFVSRVIYIATPHGGSYQARRRITGWISGLISLPGDLSRRLAVAVTDNEDLRLRNQLNRMPTSLDNMTPGHRFLNSLAKLPEAPDVTAHSIVAVDGDGPPEELTDGVVAYVSAHLDHVASERIVRSTHSVQGHPHTIAEVKRILFAHFASLDAAKPDSEGADAATGNAQVLEAAP